jgi:hypothetical protein
MYSSKIWTLLSLISRHTATGSVQRNRFITMISTHSRSSRFNYVVLGHIRQAVDQVTVGLVLAAALVVQRRGARSPRIRAAAATASAAARQHQPFGREQRSDSDRQQAITSS